MCKEMGDTYIDVQAAEGSAPDGKTAKLLVTDVLISSAFPFHVFSEILAFEKGCTATKSLNAWLFYSPVGSLLFNASRATPLGDSPRH